MCARVYGPAALDNEINGLEDGKNDEEEGKDA